MTTRAPSPAGVTVLCLATLVAIPLHAEAQAGHRYTFRVTGQDGPDATGTVSDVGARARIDMHDDADQDHSYILLSEGGHRLIFVRPAERTYSVIDDTTFEHVAGKALEGVERSGLVDMRLTQPRIQSEYLGGGPAIAGYPTKHYRLTQEYTVAIGALGFHSEDMHQRVVVDYWVTTDVRLAHNPLMEMLATVGTALAQADADFVDQATAARAHLFDGFPLRLVVHSYDEGEDASQDTRTIEVTHIEKASFDPAMFRVPAGYERRDDHFKINF